MDPISQGVLGAAAAQTATARVNPKSSTDKPERSSLWLAALVGAFAGMAPDLDVLIFSVSDPLLFLEFHRQFTHSLVFIPVGALLCSCVAHLFVKRRLAFNHTYLICLLGYATHALLDACTSYGTQLFWPFTNNRVAWNNVAVVDPLFTVPALVLVGLALIRNSRMYSWLALVWMIAYLTLGIVQRDRAIAFGTQLAEERGHTPTRLEVKPSFGNLLVWKLVYEAEGHYFIEGIRTGRSLLHIPGERVAKLDLAVHFPWLTPNSQQAKDIERFRWFSDDFLAPDKYHPHGVVDVRYSMLPNEVRGLWGIGLNPSASKDQHVEFYADRTLEAERRQRFLNMLLFPNKLESRNPNQ